jgi:hypothetical protein
MPCLLTRLPAPVRNVQTPRMCSPMIAFSFKSTMSSLAEARPVASWPPLQKTRLPSAAMASEELTIQLAVPSGMG